MTTGWKKPKAERPLNEAMTDPPKASRITGGTSAENCEKSPSRWRFRAIDDEQDLERRQHRREPDDQADVPPQRPADERDEHPHVRGPLPSA